MYREGKDMGEGGGGARGSCHRGVLGNLVFNVDYL